MRKQKLFFIFLILIVLIYSHAFVKAEVEKATQVELKISNTISSLSDVEVELFVFPRNTTVQKAILETKPYANISEEKILFKLKAGTSNFEVKANVKTNFNFVRINRNPEFINFEKYPEISQYLKATEHIDVNNMLIKNKVKQIKENLKSNNTLEILHELAEYTRRSIHYNVAYSQPQKASWVLEHRIGVCSHYTTLFLAFSRALGIPARYVSGIVYSPEKEKFVEHAWAEVYLPEYGWIPYDVTFGQYGWLDSSHILLKYSKDPAEPSVQYKYTNEIHTEKLQIDAKLKEKEVIKIPFKINLTLYKDKVALDSYVPLEVTIQNDNDFYFSLPLYLTVAPGVYGENLNIVFLKPREKAKTFFIVHIPNMSKCTEGCSATITVRDFFNNTASTTIEFSKFYQKITLEQAQSITQIRDLDFFCSTDKEYYYENENVTIKCFVKLEEKQNFQICLDKCVDFEEQIATAEFVTKATNLKCVRIKLKEKIIENCLNVEIIKRPIIEIEKVQADPVKFGNLFNISINVSSNADCEGKLILKKERKNIEKYPLSIKRGKNEIIIAVNSLKLKPGLNNLEILIIYDSYEVKEPISLYIEDVKFFKKIWLTMKKMIEIF